MYIPLTTLLPTQRQLTYGGNEITKWRNDSHHKGPVSSELSQYFCICTSWKKHGKCPRILLIPCLRLSIGMWGITPGTRDPLFHYDIIQHHTLTWPYKGFSNSLDPVKRRTTTMHVPKKSTPNTPHRPSIYNIKNTISSKEQKESRSTKFWQQNLNHYGPTTACKIWPTTKENTYPYSSKTHSIK